MKDPRFMKQAVAYSTVGIELSLMVFLFAYGGYRLDRWSGFLPLFTLIGAFAGMIIGFYRIYRALAEDDRKNREDKLDKR
jgi:F0F1-type ATP synthase assembly protein I